MMARELVKTVIVTQPRNSSGGEIGERYGEIPTAWTTPLFWNFTADIISLMLTLVSCLCLFRLAGDVIASTCLTIHTFACSSVTKLVNMISWKQMNWIRCKFCHGARDKVVNFGGQKVKGQGHTMLKLHLEASFLSYDHISKTKQDRPIVTVAYYIEVGTTDCVAAFRYSPRHLGEIFECHVKIFSTVNMTSTSTCT